MKYVKGTFVVVPNKEILKGQPASVQSVFFWICSYANDEGTCFPSRKALSNDSGCSLRTVDTAIATLCEIGVLEKINRKKDGAKLTNLFQITIGGGSAMVALPSAMVAQGGSAMVAHRTISNSNYTYTSGETKLSQGKVEEYEEVPISDVDGQITSKVPRPKKNTPEMLAVFEIFDDNPAKALWRVRTHEREAARVLYQEYGIDELKSRYSVIKHYRNHPLCPQIYSPSEFLQKMKNMESFLKNGRY